MRVLFVLATAATLTLLPYGLEPASAQAPGGAFERLSPGNQRIARSLYDAQRRELPPERRLSLDQISARKGATEGWGNVFKDMKSQGLVTQKNLGQVIDRPVARPSVTPGAAPVIGSAPRAPHVTAAPQHVAPAPQHVAPAPPSMTGGQAFGGGHGRGK